jgi:hypothetical protein
MLQDRKHTLSIQCSKAINYFDDQDELYWNAIGGNWGVDITSLLLRYFS